MVKFDKDKFENFLIKNDIIGFKKEGFKLKSKRMSYWYVNFRNLSRNFENLSKTASFVVDFLDENVNFADVDGVVGVPQGASLLGYEVQRQLVSKRTLQDRIISPRIKPKDHGDVKNRIFTNGVVPKKIIVVEDVVTTGNSCIDFVDQMEKEGVKVAYAIALLDRLQLNLNKTVREEFRERKIKYKCITDGRILSRLGDKYGKDFMSKIKEEFKFEYKNRKDLKIPNIFRT